MWKLRRDKDPSSVPRKPHQDHINEQDKSRLPTHIIRSFSSKSGRPKPSKMLVTPSSKFHYDHPSNVLNDDHFESIAPSNRPDLYPDWKVLSQRVKLAYQSLRDWEHKDHRRLPHRPPPGPQERTPDIPSAVSPESIQSIPSLIYSRNTICSSSSSPLNTLAHKSSASASAPLSTSHSISDPTRSSLSRPLHDPRLDRNSILSSYPDGESATDDRPSSTSRYSWTTLDSNSSCPDLNQVYGSIKSPVGSETGSVLNRGRPVPVSRARRSSGWSPARFGTLSNRPNPSLQTESGEPAVFLARSASAGAGPVTGHNQVPLKGQLSGQSIHSGQLPPPTEDESSLPPKPRTFAPKQSLYLDRSKIGNLSTFTGSENLKDVPGAPSVVKALPLPPLEQGDEIEEFDGLSIMELLLRDLSHRRMNLDAAEKAIRAREEAAMRSTPNQPPDPEAREDSKRKLAALWDELESIKFEEHRLALKLCRAWRRRERMSAVGGPGGKRSETGFWVNRAISCQ